MTLGPDIENRLPPTEQEQRESERAHQAAELHGGWQSPSHPAWDRRSVCAGGWQSPSHPPGTAGVCAVLTRAPLDAVWTEETG